MAAASASAGCFAEIAASVASRRWVVIAPILVTPSSAIDVNERAGRDLASVEPHQHVGTTREDTGVVVAPFSEMLDRLSDRAASTKAQWKAT